MPQVDQPLRQAGRRPLVHAFSVSSLQNMYPNSAFDASICARNSEDFAARIVAEKPLSRAQCGQNVNRQHGFVDNSGLTAAK
jgi:hypothetical protein